MGKSCCAVGCSKRFAKGCGFKFYRFPKEPERRRQWIAAVNRKNWQPSEYSWICSSHFVGGKKLNDPTSPAYSPSIFKHIKSPRKRKAEEDLRRFSRLKQSKRRRIEGFERERKEAQNRQKEAEEREKIRHEAQQERDMIEAEKRSETAEALLQLSRVEITKSLSTITELTLSDLAEVEKAASEKDVLSKENARLKEENASLRKQVISLRQAIITPESLKDCDQKVKYYTGLPSYNILKAVFDFVYPCVKNYSRTALPLFNQFLMVLARLRVNMDIEHLSYHFGIHISNVSRTLRKWINVLHERLSVLVMWPEREQLYKTMPTEFKKFGKCIVIIDCFEVFMERPSSLKARAQTWSNYKQHNTCKFLIGITPQGSISFVSQAWGGRVSDVYLTEHCGILNKLLPGDLVLADRGFSIQHSASLYCAELKIPSFTRGKAQLSKYEVDTTRDLARVRIHVERVIGLLRQKFKILSSTLPINLVMCHHKEKLSMIDKIVVICAALCNCCESVVSLT